MDHKDPDPEDPDWGVLVYSGDLYFLQETGRPST